MKNILVMLFVAGSLFGQYTYEPAYKCYPSYPDIVPQDRRANWGKAGTENCKPSTYTDERNTQGIQHVFKADDYLTLNDAINALNSDAIPENESKVLLLSNKNYFLDSPVMLKSNTIISGVSTYPGTNVIYGGVLTKPAFTIIGIKGSSGVITGGTDENSTILTLSGELPTIDDILLIKTQRMTTENFNPNPSIGINF